MGDNSSWVSHVSAHLQADVLTPFVSESLFKVIFYSEQPGKVDTLEGRYSISSRAEDRVAYSLGRQRWCLALEQRASLLTAHDERLSFSQLGVPLLEHSPLVCSYHQDLGAWPGRMGAWGIKAKVCIPQLLLLLWVINCPLSLAPNLMPSASMTRVS